MLTAGANEPIAPEVADVLCPPGTRCFRVFFCAVLRCVDLKMGAAVATVRDDTPLFDLHDFHPRPRRPDRFVWVPNEGQTGK